MVPDTKAKRQRSPSYPGVNLRDALDRAEELYKAERRNYAPVSAILQHWGYQSKSGAGFTALAALKKFGLLEDEGSGDDRRARLSDLAFHIIADTRPGSLERQQRIKDAALLPAIHRELWERYDGDLPSDATLEYELRTKRAFTDNASKEFLREFHETLEFAGVAKDDSISGASEDKHNDDEVPPPSGGGNKGGRGGWKPPMSEGNTITLPIGVGRWAMLQAPFPLTTQAWNQMIAVLNAMKPALVSDQSETQESDTDVDD